MITLQNLAYSHANKAVLFTDINLSIGTHEKIALIGNNGAGKSTLLKLIAGELQPSSGNIFIDGKPYVVPQTYGQYNNLTVSQALGVSEKLYALQQILSGQTDETYFEQLNDDWTIEERCFQALKDWDIDTISLNKKMEALSGGEKTKVFLAGISIHNPEVVLMDEPSNHLDTQARRLLYEFVSTAKRTLIVVSHDRQLLNLFDRMCELSHNGISTYGGNYDFYQSQKEIENKALSHDIHAKEKALRKAKEKERETIVRQQKLDARGKGKQEKSGVARIMMNTLKNNAENSTAKLRGAHAEKIENLGKDLQDLRASVNSLEQMRFMFSDSDLHKGKLLIEALGINYRYGEEFLLEKPIDFEIISGDRVAVKGENGSGKTTLIQLMRQVLKPSVGKLQSGIQNALYIDQDYSLINNKLSVYEQVIQFNEVSPEEHIVKTQLHRFLFERDSWDLTCSVLSGGERLKLLLCCISLSGKAPELIILDEPTNNLDIQNIEILTKACNQYNGTLIVVSHDQTFLDEININKIISI